MEFDLKLFRHKTAIQIRFKDCDMMGHINNANHFTYFELARVSYFDDVVNEEINWNEQGIILAHVEIDYKKPILLNDKLFVYSRVSKLGNKSFDFEYCIVVEMNGENIIVATGKSIQVCYNYRINQTVEIPGEWKSKVIAYEQ